MNDYWTVLQVLITVFSGRGGGGGGGDCAGFNPVISHGTPYATVFFHS